MDGHPEPTPDADPPAAATTVSRRRLLGGVGLAAGAAAVPGVAIAGGHRRGGPGDGAATSSPMSGTGGARSRPFSRAFPDLPPFAEPTEEVREALTALGAAGGPMDAQDPVEVGAVRLAAEPELSPLNLDNERLPAGATFVGQFLDHELTLDADSPLGRPLHVQRSSNLRTGNLDLDAVYGGGPELSPQLYQQDGLHLRVESGGRFEDLPRDDDGTALIGDPRNDENLLVSQLHAAFLRFHNAVVHGMSDGEVPTTGEAGAAPATGTDGSAGARPRGDGRGRRPRAPGGRPRPARDTAHGTVTSAGAGDVVRASAVLAEVRRVVCWHWQWILVHQVVPWFCGDDVAAAVAADGPRFVDVSDGLIPVEFSGAAYRFGHSMVRPSYLANHTGNPPTEDAPEGTPFGALLFDPSQHGAADPDDLRGGVRAPRRFVDWSSFFDFGDGNLGPNKRIDTRLTSALFDLPIGTIAVPRGQAVGPTSLATRNLLRHLTWELPSGQEVARAMDEEPLHRDDLEDLGGLGGGLQESTPLWFYVLREADLVAGGQHLGPVGGRIVAETIIGLLDRDPGSYRNAGGWSPSLPSAEVGTFGITDLLTVAGVDPAGRAAEDPGPAV